MWSERPAPRAAPAPLNLATPGFAALGLAIGVGAAILGIWVAGMIAPDPGPGAGQAVGLAMRVGSGVAPAAAAAGGTAIEACGHRVGGSPGAAPAAGAWWRTMPILDPTGTLRGWTLETGGPGLPGVPGGPIRRAILPVEAAVSGPTDGTIVVTADDGRASSVTLVDAATGCATTVQPPEGVVRRAILDRPGDLYPERGVLAHLVARNDRADLGIWRLRAGAPPTRVLGPLEERERSAAGVGRTWSTDLLVDETGARLAVQSCDDRRCLIRILDRRSGLERLLAGDDQGALIGFAGERLITWASGHGFPTPILAWEIGTGPSMRLVRAATGAAITPDGRALVVSRPGEDGERVDAIDPTDGSAHPASPPAGGARPFRSWPGAGAGIEPGIGDVPAMAPDGQPVLVHVESLP